jgi:hypothetical protein
MAMLNAVELLSRAPANAGIASFMDFIRGREEVTA